MCRSSPNILVEYFLRTKMLHFLLPRHNQKVFIVGDRNPAFSQLFDLCVWRLFEITYLLAWINLSNLDYFHGSTRTKTSDVADKKLNYNPSVCDIIEKEYNLARAIYMGTKDLFTFRKDYNVTSHDDEVHNSFSNTTLGSHWLT